MSKHLQCLHGLGLEAIEEPALAYDFQLKTGVASDDMDFDRVAGIERHWVINAPNGE